MDWQLLEQDQELFRRELDSFVPDRIFDAHAHLYARGMFNGDPPGVVGTGPEVVDLDEYRRQIDLLLPGRQVSGLFFGFPNPAMDLAAGNRFLMEQVRRDPASRGQMMVRPNMDPEWIRAEARREGFVGLKCYHVYATEEPTFNAPIPSYLPEEQVRIAHEEGLSITLHLVRPRALADPVNQEVIRAYCERYPNVKLILAHAARGFNPHHTIEGIGTLRGLPNLWCDCSAVTDAGACEAILLTLGVERLLWGSDFPVSHTRGRCVAIGDSFLWLSPDNTDFAAHYAHVQPTWVGLESLRVLKLAAMTLRLTDAEVEAIFWGNAQAVWGIAA
jgi:glutamate-1-semialdehyde 2,1-aminomutase